MTQEETDTAMEFVAEMASLKNLNVGHVMCEVSHFKLSQGFFDKDYIWSASKTCQPWMWWTAICSTTQLSKIAAAILSLPASSAATERSFSSFEGVHSKKRNRLLNERIHKLVFIRHNSRLLCGKDETSGAAAHMEMEFENEGDTSESDSNEGDTSASSCSESDLD